MKKTDDPQTTAFEAAIAKKQEPSQCNETAFESRVPSNFTRPNGLEKSKGGIMLHTLDGDLATGRNLERWEKIMQVLKRGEMPPEDAPQPNEAKRRAIGQRIEPGLRARHLSLNRKFNESRITPLDCDQVPRHNVCGLSKP